MEDYSLMDNNQMKQTKFDSMVTNQTMQIIKAVIPYIDNPMGKYIGMFIKFRELQNAMNISSNLSLAATNTDKHKGMEGMLEDIIDFLGDDTRETFENLKGMMDMMEAMNGMDMNEDMMSAFMGSAFGGDAPPSTEEDISSFSGNTDASSNINEEDTFHENENDFYDENNDAFSSKTNYEKGFNDYE